MNGLWTPVEEGGFTISPKEVQRQYSSKRIADPRPLPSLVSGMVNLLRRV
jgi:hypothetical protein